MNKAILTGRVGNATVKQHGESYVVNFSVATTEKEKVNGEWTDTTEWHNCSYWTKSEKYAGMIAKGAMVLVHGKIKTREHESKKYTSIAASEVEILVYATTQAAQVEQNDLPW